MRAARAAAADFVLALGSSAAATPIWTAEELATLRALSRSAMPRAPAHLSNRVADEPAARDLGRKLFFGARLSANGKVSCASCHQPGRGFTDGLPVGRGVAEGSRR